MAIRKLRRMDKIVAAMALTVAFFVAEIVVGHVTGSIVLIANSFHMLSNPVALAVGLIAVRISKMDSFGKNTFGWVRAEVLGALVNAVFLLALCFTIFVDSLLRLIETEPTENPDLLVIVGSVSLGINLLGMLIFYDRTATCRHQGIRRSSVPERRPLKASATEAVALLMPPAETEEPNEFSVHSLTNMADSVHVGGDHTQESTELVVIRPKADPTQPAVRHLSGMASASSSSRNDRVLANEQDTTCIENNSRISSGPRSSSQLNMRGIFLHLMGHAVEAASVVVGSMLVWLVPDSMGEDHINWKPYVDPALSLILVVFIVSTTIPLLKESAMILLQTLPTKLSIHDIKQAVSKVFLIYTYLLLNLQEI